MNNELEKKVSAIGSLIFNQYKMLESILDSIPGVGYLVFDSELNYITSGGSQSKQLSSKKNIDDIYKETMCNSTSKEEFRSICKNVFKNKETQSSYQLDSSEKKIVIKRLSSKNVEDQYGLMLFIDK